MEAFFNSIFGFLHMLTESLRGIISSLFPSYATLAILGISVLGGAYIAKKFPNLLTKSAIAAYTIIIFLILKFI